MIKTNICRPGPTGLQVGYSPGYMLKCILGLFFTRHPTGGSFVRPKKVDFGISIFEALKQRYGQGGDSINEEDMYVMSGNNRWKAVEMVGADSIQQKQGYLILNRT